jgi:uncharacterized protein YndB with AHSA1/START domain
MRICTRRCKPCGTPASGRRSPVSGGGGPPSPELRKQHEEMGFHEGWATVLDQLVEVAKTL